MSRRLLPIPVGLWILLAADHVIQVTLRQTPFQQEIVTSVGASITLECELRNATGAVRWLLNGELVTTETGERHLATYNDTEDEHVLHIGHVLLDDDGLWHCQESRDQDALIFTSEPIRVIVTVAPEKNFVVFEDRRLADGASFTIKEKNTVTFTCIIGSANPAPQRVDWLLGEFNLSSQSHLVEDFSTSERLYQSRSTLTFEVTRKHHRKSLRCVVHHLALVNPASAILTFNILYTPSFLISRVPAFGYPIREGIAVSLRCEIDANPPSKPEWIKDDGPPPVEESMDGYLNFTSITREQAGWYRCSTHHEFGFSTSFGYFLNVRYAPEIIHQPPPQVQVGLGGSVMLECAADGKPPPSYCWARIKDGGKLESLAMEQNLLLDRILYTDAGVYKCIARNQIGWEERRADSREVQVVVTGKPEVEPVNRTLMAIVGKPASIAMQFCANPLPSRVHWIIQSTLLNPGDITERFIAHNITATDETNCYQALLDILDVKKEDAGEFMFLVKNTRGIDDGVVWLNITQASFSISSAPILINFNWLIIMPLLVIIYHASVETFGS